MGPEVSCCNCHICCWTWNGEQACISLSRRRDGGDKVVDWTATATATESVRSTVSSKENRWQPESRRTGKGTGRGEDEGR